MSFQNVPLSEISEQRPYFEVAFPPAKPLRCIPPWLILLEGEYYILDGFVEVQQAIIDNADSMGVKILDAPPLALWQMLLERRASLEQISASLFLELLTSLQQKTEIQLDAPEVLAEARKFAIQDKWITKQNLQALQESKQVLEQFTDYPQLGGKEIQALSRLSTEEQKAMQSLFFGQKLRGNKLTSMITLIRELKKGFQIQLTDLQADTKLWGQLQDKPYAQVKQKLEEMRYPRLTAQKKLLQEAEKQLPKNVTLDVNPNFEEDTCKLIIESASEEELAKQLQALSKIQQEKSLQPIFNLIF